ncbi:MAG: T9SS type A sorting domain-containing protein [candidate division KSB1 bacterium]|nr:T9SS type A sorting domain-containing protein [candidate division KSB1 bacterium]
MRKRLLVFCILLVSAAAPGVAQSDRMSSQSYAIDRDAFLNAGGTYDGGLLLTDRLGTPNLSRMQGKNMVIGTAVREALSNSESFPDDFAFWGNYPNPFNERTIFRFALPKTAQVRLEIYSLLGQRLLVLLQDQLPPGRYEVPFEGADENGALLPSGVYFCRLTTKEFEKSQKLLILR